MCQIQSILKLNTFLLTIESVLFYSPGPTLWCYFDSSHSLILHVLHMLLPPLLNHWNISISLTEKSFPFPNHLMPELLHRLLSSISASNLCPLMHLLWCYHIICPKVTFPLCYSLLQNLQ